MHVRKIALFLGFALASATSALHAANAVTVIECKPGPHAGGVPVRLYPTIYIKQNALCFDATSWMNYEGRNCLDSKGSADWNATVLLVSQGQSVGRDHTQFRVRDAKFTDEKIEYLVEWSRGKEWHPLQKIGINRLTGVGVDWAIGEHGGTPMACEAKVRKIP